LAFVGDCGDHTQAGPVVLDPQYRRLPFGRISPSIWRRCVQCA
jgi:hypothetical protein